MTAGTLLGWTPRTPTAFARPVLDESASAGLCGTTLPDGRGLLVWPNAGRARFAVTPSTDEWLITDSVPSAAFATITTGESTDVRTTSCYSIGGQVYATVVTFNGSRCTTRLWRANDMFDPYAGWSVVATLQDSLTPGSRFGFETWGAGVPLQLPSGRLVFVQGCWEFGHSAGAEASGANSAAWTSDAGMAGPWTIRMQERHINFFPRIEFASAQVGRNPANGRLYWSTATGAGGTPNMWIHESQDDGTSWGRFNTSVVGSFEGWNGNSRITAFVDNGASLYSFGGSGDGNGGGLGDDVLELTGDPYNSDVNPADNPGWTPTGQLWNSYGGSIAPRTRKGVVEGDAVFFFEADRVGHTPGPPPVAEEGWLVVA